MAEFGRQWWLLVTGLVMFLTTTTRGASSSISFRPSLQASRALDATIPLHQMFSQDLTDGEPGGENNELDNKNSATKAPVPPKFDIDTFTFNKKNIRKAGDIFSLLADVEDSKLTKTEKSSPTKQKAETTNTTPSDNKADSTKSKPPGMDLANLFGKDILVAGKDLEGLLKVILRMKKKVQAKLGNSTSSSIPILSSGTTAHIANLLMNTTKLQELQTAGLTAGSEDEFLDHLTEVLSGADTRSGTALTLDPVTIIALLTLAAYLIRAVYQILTVTGRSLDAGDMAVPLHLSDLPEAMVAIHNWISATEFSHVSREKRSLPYVSTILDIPGNLAAIIKLHREGHQPCVRQFLCEQLQDRTFPEVTLTDIFIAAMGYYFGDTDLGSYIDMTIARSSSPTSCAIVPDGCSPRTLTDAHYLEDLYTRASYKFFNLLAAMTGLL